MALATTAGCGGDPVEVDEPSMSAAQRATCEDLVGDVPERVADQERREVEPAGVLGAAWGEPAIVLTCGVGRPTDYDPTNGCTTVNGVDWYIPMAQLEANGGEDLTMTTIERDVAVRVVLPGEHWPPALALADLSDVVTEHTHATGRCR